MVVLNVLHGSMRPIKKKKLNKNQTEFSSTVFEKPIRTYSSGQQLFLLLNHEFNISFLSNRLTRLCDYSLVVKKK